MYSNFLKLVNLIFKPTFIFIILLSCQGCAGGFLGGIFAKVGLTNNVTDTINHAISEADDIIEQLEEASTNIAGEAGYQVRETVSELTASVESVLDALENTTGGVLNELEGTTVTLLKELTTTMSDLNDLILKDIDCIDKVLANQIANLTDNALKIVETLNQEVNYTIDNVFENATEFTDFFGNKVALLGSQVVTWIVRIGLILFAVLLSFWQIKRIYRWIQEGRKKRGPWQVILPIISFALVGGATFIFLNPALVHAFTGNTVALDANIDEWHTECNKGAEIYSEFLAQYNTNPTDEAQYSEKGLKAINQIGRCIFVSSVAEVEEVNQLLIDKIKVILFPPPVIDNRGDIKYADCNEEEGRSIPPILVSSRLLDKIRALNLLKQEDIKINPRVIRDGWQKGGGVVDPMNQVMINELDRAVNIRKQLEITDRIRANFN